MMTGGNPVTVELFYLRNKDFQPCSRYMFITVRVFGFSMLVSVSVLAPGDFLGLLVCSYGEIVVFSSWHLGISVELWTITFHFICFEIPSLFKRLK